MQEIVVISGKGGTGKTMIVSGLAVITQKKVIVDCAAELPHLNLLLPSEFTHKENFFCGLEYYRVEADCLHCGKCQAVCQHNAIDNNYDINSLLCTECAACYTACPNKAIERLEKMVGYCSFFDTKYGNLVQADLNPGENSAGKLIAQVKKEARRIATEQNAEYLIIDGPPGIGCPVNAALTGSQLALVVTEPTLSGMHDLKRIIEVCKRFKMNIFVVINKADLDQNNNKIIKELCLELQVAIAGEIRYSETVIETINMGKSILETFPDHDVSRSLKAIWQKLTA